jgi:protein gp37
MGNDPLGDRVKEYEARESDRRLLPMVPVVAGLMATLENQPVWDRDFHKLMEVPAAWHGVSAEPLLGPIDIGDARPNWLISGGESGPGFRSLDMNAVRSLRDQCARNGIVYHHKQNGGVQGKDAGCLIDGMEHKNFPPELAA